MRRCFCLPGVRCRVQALRHLGRFDGRHGFCIPSTTSKRVPHVPRHQCANHREKCCGRPHLSILRRCTNALCHGAETHDGEDDDPRGWPLDIRLHGPVHDNEWNRDHYAGKRQTARSSRHGRGGTPPWACTGAGTFDAVVIDPVATSPMPTTPVGRHWALSLGTGDRSFPQRDHESPLPRDKARKRPSARRGLSGFPEENPERRAFRRRIGRVPTKVQSGSRPNGCLQGETYCALTSIVHSNATVPRHDVVTEFGVGRCHGRPRGTRPPQDSRSRARRSSSAISRLSRTNAANLNTTWTNFEYGARANDSATAAR